MIISITWLFIAAFITSVLPLLESRQAMGTILGGVIHDISGHGNVKEGKATI